jgi:hypothetical protein
MEKRLSCLRRPGAGGAQLGMLGDWGQVENGDFSRIPFTALWCHRCASRPCLCCCLSLVVIARLITQRQALGRACTAPHDVEAGPAASVAAKNMQQSQPQHCDCSQRLRLASAGSPGEREAGILRPRAAVSTDI